MITIKVKGLSELTSSLKKKILDVKDKDKVVRTIATTLCAEVGKRIHKNGLNASGVKIGDYDPKYLKVRQKKYNRSADKKVIISLTGQLENDFSIGQTNPIPTQNGWGLGFKNEFNAEKSEWMEEKYGPIWSLTKDEQDMVKKVAEFEVNKILKQK